MASGSSSSWTAAFVHRGYARELDRVFRRLAAILLPSFLVEIVNKILFFSSVSVPAPLPFQVLHASVIVELAPIVKFLRGLDVERSNIPFVLHRYPELLGFKLEGTMSTSIAYLVSLGISPRDIGPMVTQFPFFLGLRIGTTIKPLVDFLLSLGFPKKIVAQMLEKRPYILDYKGTDNDY